MKQSRITYVVHGQNVPSKDRLFSHLVVLNPRFIIVLDEPGLAREIAERFPECTVIFRWNGDGGDGSIYTRMMPKPWLAMMMNKLGGDRRIMLYTNNESGLPRRLIAWLTELIPLANEIGVSLCCLNLQTGNPQPDDWEMAKPVLELLATDRRHVLGLHEYAGSVITSGLYGGYPDNANVEPGKPGGVNLIKPEHWPTPNQVTEITRYHVGRFKFLLDYCDREHIKYPRIVVTEHGFDDTSDIKPYLETLLKTPPFQNIRGWRSLVNQWKAWFPQWSAERAYFMQIKWANEVIYKESPVEAQCIFSWGNSGGWEQFDVATSHEFQDLLAAYANEPKDQSPVFPLPTAAWIPSENFSGSAYRLRLVAQIDDTPELGWVKAGEKFSYIGIEGDATWMYGKNWAGIIGYVSRDILSIEPPKPAPPPDPTPKPPYMPDEEARKLADVWRSLLVKKQHERGKLDAEIIAIQWTINKLETGQIELLDDEAA